MYSAAVAAGMTSTFGAPFGALLFAIEVSSTYYMVSNLFKGFFCACFALIIFKITDLIPWLHMFFPTRFPTQIEINHELLLFALLGILAGLLSAVFVQIMTNIIFARHRLELPYVSDRWRWCLAVALISGLIKFPVPFLNISDYRILNHMFALSDLDQVEGKSSPFLICLLRWKPLD
jgi:H+/Cl- antiporter ClcA